MCLFNSDIHKSPCIFDAKASYPYIVSVYFRVKLSCNDLLIHQYRLIDRGILEFCFSLCMFTYWRNHINVKLLQADKAELTLSVFIESQDNYPDLYCNCYAFSIFIGVLYFSCVLKLFIV